MGGGQPYMYDASPNRFSNVNLDPYNGFNPKAVSQASFAPMPPKPKPDGPLINFNRHPDSYLIMPQASTNAKDMHPNTKKRVSRARTAQLTFRFLELIAAVGVLICVICLRSTQTTESWIMRLPPSIDIGITLYAIYHLIRRAKYRTPASSASYHFFSLFMDTGLIPFYVFIAMLGNAQSQQLPGTKGRWTSFLADIGTSQLIQATWIAAAATAGLHVASLILDLYLIVMFRKIARLPPDMNPLEDNLTSRRKNKHKYKNSEMSMNSDLTASCVNSNRTSHISDLQDPDPRQISFIQSRNAKNGDFSPHNPKTARMSQVNLSENIYQHPKAASPRVHRQERENQSSNGSPFRTSAMPSAPVSSKRTSVVSSMHSYDDSGYGRSHKGHVSNEELQADNWFVLGQDDDHNANDKSHLHAPQPTRVSKLNRLTSNISSNRSYQPVAHDVPDEDLALSPLKMNPPTPPPQPIVARMATQPMSQPPSQNSHQYQAEEEDARTRTMTSGVTELTDSSHYSHDDRASDTASSSRSGPKSRFYGDLAAAMRGVRQGGNSPRPKSMHGSVHYTQSESEHSMYNENARVSPATGRARPKSHVESATGTVVRKARKSEDDDDDAERFGGYTRVVSRSGVDVASGGKLGVTKGRREVSGKVAEEGRGGGWLRGGLFMRKASGKA